MKPGFARRFLLRWPGLFIRVFVPDDTELGELGEEVAARVLRRRGYRILARRVRTAPGDSSARRTRMASAGVSSSASDFRSASSR